MCLVPLRNNLLSTPLLTLPATARDLAEIKRSGALRQIGIPHANFVTSAGDALDGELIQNFAGQLGVRCDFFDRSAPMGS